MKICIPTRDDSGLEGRLHNHFGSTPFFTIVDTLTGSVEVLPNSDAESGHSHGHGTCRALKQAGLPPFDAVVCRSMGRRALATLMDEGLEVLVTRRKTVAEVVEAVKDGEPARLSSLDACEGHHERRGGHGHVRESR
jgi:predicted Fe-Mo cluster-binding NifX family protein